MVINTRKNVARKLSTYYQIGNYYYSNSIGDIQVVINHTQKLDDHKIAEDMNRLLKRYGVNVVNRYLECCSEYLKNR